MLDDLERQTSKHVTTHLPKKNITSAATGLEAALYVIRGNKVSTMIDGTRDKWTDFKNKDEVKDELETYKKGKQRYTDRMAFLARSNVREWEFEQKSKRKQR